MCGYCLEITAIDILRTEIYGVIKLRKLDFPTHKYFYLRETLEFNSALDKLKRSMSQKKMSFFSEVPAKVLLYRGIEILLEKGFDSPAYQQLLKKPIYREAINICCTSEERNKFETLTKGLQVEPLGLLYEAETYYWKDKSNLLRILADVLPACRNLLKQYILYWLENTEVSIKNNDIHQEESSRSEKNTSNANFDFDHLIRSLYFSILFLGKYQVGINILSKIAQKPPVNTPFFDGVDLWLQRVAALKLYDLEGFDKFRLHITKIRPTNFYYINLIRNFSTAQKQSLLDHLEIYPEDNRSDDFINLSEWLISEMQ